MALFYLSTYVRDQNCLLGYMVRDILERTVLSINPPWAISYF